MSTLRNRNDAANFFDAARQSFADNPSVGIYGLSAFVGQPEAAALPPGPVAIIDTVPGDTSTTATLTVDAAPIVSAIDTIADQDFYQITLVAGHDYQIGMFGYTPQGPGDPVGPNGAPLLDSFIELYDSGGNLITSADGGSDTVLNSANSGFDALLTFTATESGTYYVNARAFDNVPADGSDGDMIGDYGLYAEDVTDDPGVFTPYYDADSPLYAIDWGTQVNKVHQSYRNPDGDEGTRDTGNPQSVVDPGAALGHPGKNVISIYFAQAGDIFVSNDPTNPGLPPATITATGVQGFEHDAVMTALGEFAKVADVVYIEVNDRNAADFIYTSYQGTPGPGVSLLGSMSPPDEPDEGLAQFNSGDSRWNATDLQQGGFSFVTLIHEFGHGHGLAHPHDNGGHSGIMHGVEPEGAGVADYTTGDYELNQGVFTMMSYEDGWQSSPYGNAPTTGGYGYLGGLMAFDIAAIQDKYGVNEDWATGNDTYVLKDVNAAGTYYSSIWDGGGIDSIVYSGARDTNIDLRAATLEYEFGGGGWVSYAYGIFGGFTIANGVTIENATSGAGNDTLIGNDVANVLDGGAGADTMTGGDGNDTFIVDNVGDQAIETSLLGGTDEVQSAVTFTLGSNVENLVLTGIMAINGTGNALANMLTGNDANNILNGGLGADFLKGGLGDDTYVVDDSGDVVSELAGQGTDNVQSSISFNLSPTVENLNLIGTADIDGTGNILANIIMGNSGANTLNGGAGADTMSGGLGNDTYIVDNAGDTVTETSAVGGTDQVQSSVSFTLASNIETLTLTGASSINGTGNASVNTITGNNAANILDGGFGADTMQGNGGNDTYIIDNAGDVAIEAAGGGIDTIQTSLNHTLAAEFERLVLTGTGNLNGTGNAAANILTGNSGANQLDGAGGGDIMQGGLGNDSYFVDNGLDQVVEAAGGGIDTVNASLSHDLDNEVENLVLTGVAAINGTGNSLANTLTGNSANNILNGGLGADTLKGGLGDDTYVVDNAGDVVSDLAGQGTDLVKSSVSFTLGAATENLNLTGSGAIDGTGNIFANVLNGNDGANTLNGGGGADTMNGGLGNDTYIVDNAGDVAFETSLTGGTDEVQSSVTFTLSSYIENLTLTGASAVNGTGNSFANNITGNAQANVLNGLVGDDQLHGAGGNDSLHGGIGMDTLEGGAGSDGFYFESALNTANVDDVLDFATVDDTIFLDDAVFTQLAAGSLDAAAFRTGPTALDADDRILYDSATGQIFYDADGSGGGSSAILFATVAPATIVTAADFMVY